jgi:hypothetical protein
VQIYEKKSTWPNLFSKKLPIVLRVAQETTSDGQKTGEERSNKYRLNRPIRRRKRKTVTGSAVSWW